MTWVKFTKPMQPTLTDDFRPVKPDGLCTACSATQYCREHAPPGKAPRLYRAVKDRQKGKLIAEPVTRHQLDPWGQQAKMAEMRYWMAQGMSREEAEKKVWDK